MDRQVELTAVQETRLTTAAFYGYRRQRRIPDGYMSETRNMTTDEYPCACVRQPRTEPVNTGDGRELRFVPFYGHRIADAIPVDGDIAYLTDGAGQSPQAFLRDRHWELAGGTGSMEGRIVAYGNGLFCPQTGHYIPNRAADACYPAAVDCTGDYTATFVDAGNEAVTPSAEKPEEPEEGAYWYDGDANALYVYTEDGWQPVPVYRTKLTTADASVIERLRLLRDGDVVVMTVDGAQTAARISCLLFDDNVPNASVVLAALLPPGEYAALPLRRRYPSLTAAVASNNRIWGCVYEQDGDACVNEICASRLGDPLNWTGGELLEEDPFVLTVGEPGEWTGAATLNGYPVFFKETCMVTVYGNSASSFYTSVLSCDGVASGSSRSLTAINGALYYHSPRGIMRMLPGGYPVCVSDDLSRKNIWENAIGGTDGRKYYVEMTDLTDYDAQAGSYSRRLYVYDTELGVWQTEDAAGDHCVSFVRLRSELLSVANGQEDGARTVKLAYISGLDFGLSPLPYTWLAGFRWEGDAPVLTAPWDSGYPEEIVRSARQDGSAEWSFATGDYGHVVEGGNADSANAKRVKDVDIRCYVAEGADFSVSVMYDDDGVWRPLSASTFAGREGTRRVSCRLRRCDLYRLRFAGTGTVCIFSITQIYEEAGDRAYDALQSSRPAAGRADGR